MDEFLLQPGIYSTSTHQTLFQLLEALWLDPAAPTYTGGTYYLLAGFSTHNGGVPFFERMRHHTASGGRVRAVLAGSRTMNLSSRQLGRALLDCGVEVSVVNRKRLMHAKLYGTLAPTGEQTLVVTSGNFTTPGTKLNIEAAVALGPEQVQAIGFSWEAMLARLSAADIDLFNLVDDAADPVWTLLYDEEARRPQPSDVEEDEYVEGFGSMVFTLSGSDTARIQAEKGSDAYKGSQYFWLSKDSYDFFPPLVIRNKKGVKATYSALITVAFVDLGVTEVVRVTFEAENNFDFRLGTGPLRGSKLASRGDLAVLTRRGESSYELRILRAGTPGYHALRRYALTQVGHQGKVAGFAPKKAVDAVFHS